MPNISISYSHKNRDWLERFQTFLKPLFAHDDEILDASDPVVWDDTLIAVGSEWYEKIRLAIQQSRVVVMLVTPDYVASDFIRRHELPMIFRAQRDQGVIPFWVAVSASPYESLKLDSIQALNQPTRPLDQFGGPELNVEMVRMSRIIREETLKEPPPKPRQPPLHKIIELEMEQTILAIADEQRRLWISDGQLIRILPTEAPQEPQICILPNQPWKCHLEGLWRNRLVFADWEGSLYQCGPEDPKENTVLYKARHDDMPIHLLAAGPSGQLAAAAWNGLIRTWDGSGTLRPSNTWVRTDELPTHLLPMENLELAVADQGRNLALYGAEGAEQWRSKMDGPVLTAWACQGRQTPTVIVQVGADRLVEIINGRPRNDVRFKSPIVSISRRRGGPNEEWIAVATENGSIDWLASTATGFSLVQSCHADTGLKVRQLKAVYDPRQADRFLTLVLTAEKTLMAVNNRTLTAVPLDGLAQDLALTPDGRVLFILGGAQVLALHNPLLAPAL